MNKYNIFCYNCSFKKTIKTVEDIKEFRFVDSSSIQKSIPQIDYLTNQIKPSTNRELPRKVKCPKCGFAIRLKLIKEDKNDNTNE